MEGLTRAFRTRRVTEGEVTRRERVLWRRTQGFVAPSVSLHTRNAVTEMDSGATVRSPHAEAFRRPTPEVPSRQPTWIAPWRTAKATASSFECTRSLPRMFRTWVCTVCGLM
jgi:hypothetical protein